MQWRQKVKLVLASDNKGKLREFGALFADHGIEVVSQGSLGVTPCEAIRYFSGKCPGQSA